MTTVGTLLAGGQARRMGGGDKCLRKIAGKPLLAHVVARIEPQVDTLILNANGDPARFADYPFPVVPDVVPDYAGPLAGVLTGMRWARDNTQAEWVLTVATDAPFLPHDLAGGLHAAIADQSADMACAASGGRNHPVIGLWPVRLHDALETAMVEQDIRKVDRWTGQYRLAVVEFTAGPPDPFFNANRPEDIEKAEEYLSA